MSNLPDDWGTYHRSCGLCGSRYHASGVDECRCRPCAICEKDTAPDDMDVDVTCRSCAENGIELDNDWISVMPILRVVPGVPMVPNHFDEPRINLESRDGFAFAMTHAYAHDQGISSDDAFWSAVEARHYARETTHDDRVALSGALAEMPRRGGR